jgi:hypothetical protein
MQNIHEKGLLLDLNNFKISRLKLCILASFAAQTVIQKEMGRRTRLGIQMAQKGVTIHSLPIFSNIMVNT